MKELIKCNQSTDNLDKLRIMVNNLNDSNFESVNIKVKECLTNIKNIIELNNKKLKRKSNPTKQVEVYKTALDEVYKNVIENIEIC